jgi:hypothetical protein
LWLYLQNKCSLRNIALVCVLCAYYNSHLRWRGHRRSFEILSRLRN